MSTFDAIFWGVLLVVLVITTRIATKREKKIAVNRSQFMAKHSFIEEGHVYSDISKHGFSLIDRVSGNYGDYETTNVIRKLKGNDEFFIFDFQYTPKNADQSVALDLETIRAVMIKLKDRELSHFDILPESIVERIKQIFGSSDIYFEKYPVFSKKYVLKSYEPESSKMILPEELIKYLESKNGIFIEARNKYLLIYKDQGGQFADYEILYKEAEAIYSFLR